MLQRWVVSSKTAVSYTESTKIAPKCRGLETKGGSILFNGLNLGCHSLRKIGQLRIRTFRSTITASVEFLNCWKSVILEFSRVRISSRSCELTKSKRKNFGSGVTGVIITLYSLIITSHSLINLRCLP